MSDINNYRKCRPIGMQGVLFVSLLCLLLGHLLLKEYMPIAALGAVGFFALTGLLYYVLVTRRDVFSYILIIFICSHFSYADNQGGLWNLLTFGLVLIYFLAAGAREGFGRKDPVINGLLFVLLISNVIGWIFKNPAPLIDELLGAANFFGYILMFKLVSDIRLTPDRTRQYLIVVGIMLAYLIAVAINQRYAFVNYNSPLLGAYGAEHGSITYGSTNAQGTFRNSELFGEYSVLMFTLLMPVLCASVVQKALRIKVSVIIFMVLLCIAGVLLTSTRSAAILLIAISVMYAIVFTIRLFSSVDASSRQIVLVFTAVIFIGLAGAFIGLDSLEDDIQELSNIDFSVDSVASGEAINRGPLTELALKRIESQSWLIGYGFGVPRSNLWAWLGYDPGRKGASIADYHNLYLSLPMLYGWFGSLAFLLLVIVTAFRCQLTALKFRLKRDYLMLFIIGFAVFWPVFLADQFKISILRNANYHMLFWIWLGFSNAVVRSLRYPLKRSGFESIVGTEPDEIATSRRQAATRRKVIT